MNTMLANSIKEAEEVREGLAGEEALVHACGSEPRAPVSMRPGS